MNHYFSVENAKTFGLVPSIILENLIFWITKNKANNKHLHNGRTWTYNSIRAFGLLFPYLGNKQIQNALDFLENNEVIINGPVNARSLQRGIRPGTWPKGYAKIIRDWAIAKGLSFQTNEELERFSYAVANKIKQEGSRQFRTHTYYDIYDSPFEECMDRITNRLSSSYLDLILDNIE